MRFVSVIDALIALCAGTAAIGVVIVWRAMVRCEDPNHEHAARRRRAKRGWISLGSLLVVAGILASVPLNFWPDRVRAWWDDYRPHWIIRMEIRAGSSPVWAALEDRLARGLLDHEEVRAYYDLAVSKINPPGGVLPRWRGGPDLCDASSFVLRAWQEGMIDDPEVGSHLASCAEHLTAYRENTWARIGRAIRADAPSVIQFRACPEDRIVLPSGLVIEQSLTIEAVAMEQDGVAPQNVGFEISPASSSDPLSSSNSTISHIILVPPSGVVGIVEYLVETRIRTSFLRPGAQGPSAAASHRTEPADGAFEVTTTAIFRAGANALAADMATINPAAPEPSHSILRAMLASSRLIFAAKDQALALTSIEGEEIDRLQCDLLGRLEAEIAGEWVPIALIWLDSGGSFRCAPEGRVPSTGLSLSATTMRVRITADEPLLERHGIFVGTWFMGETEPVDIAVRVQESLPGAPASSRP